MLISKIKYYVKLNILKYKWKKKNSHNSTSITKIMDIDSIKVGKFSYGAINVNKTDSCNNNLIIGDFCSIADEVVFLLGVEHRIDCFSTFPFKTKVLGEKPEAFSKGDIVVNDNVWIGQRALILSGVTIGQGAVIAAGAVVTKDVPPYEVWGGVPAKKIKSRFSDEIIQELLKVDFSKVDKDFIIKNKDKLYDSIKNLESLDYLPKIDKEK